MNITICEIDNGFIVIGDDLHKYCADLEAALQLLAESFDENAKVSLEILPNSSGGEGDE
jgi:hypothetical protein